MDLIIRSEGVIITRCKSSFVILQYYVPVDKDVTLVQWMMNLRFVKRGETVSFNHSKPKDLNKSSVAPTLQ